MVSLCNKELRSWTDLIFKDTPWGTPTLTVAPKTLCREIFLSAPYSTMVPKKPALEWQNQELFRQRRHLNFSLLNTVIPKQVKHENASVCSRCWPLEDSWCISKVRLDFPACQVVNKNFWLSYLGWYRDITHKVLQVPLNCRGTKAQASKTFTSPFIRFKEAPKGHRSIWFAWNLEAYSSRRGESSGCEQCEFPLEHLLERTFHSCLILILKLMLVTDHHERMGDSQLKHKGTSVSKHTFDQCFPRFPFSTLKHRTQSSACHLQPLLSVLSWPYSKLKHVNYDNAKSCALPNSWLPISGLTWDIPAASLTSNPMENTAGTGRWGCSLPGGRITVPLVALTCIATVKWLVLVSRTILVFMADWMPHLHCK